MNCRTYWIALFFASVIFLCGFDFSQHSVPTGEIIKAGPRKDGIPALYNPDFITAPDDSYLKDTDRVIGVYYGGEAKAYPLRILVWHELVNDTIGGKDALITYCPLTGSGIVFDPAINDARFLFGVSGRLYNSCLVLYDKQTKSLWSQLKMEAVTGSMTGKSLLRIPSVNTTWGAWKNLYPDTRVLSVNTGYDRDYTSNPYADYENSKEIIFPVLPFDKRVAAKEWVIGIVIDGHAKAYPEQELAHAGMPLSDTVGGTNIVINYDRNSFTVSVHDQEGNFIPSVRVYWFAWAAFYPDTKVFSLDRLIGKKQSR